MDLHGDGIFILFSSLLDGSLDSKGHFVFFSKSFDVFSTLTYYHSDVIIWDNEVVPDWVQVQGSVGAGCVVFTKDKEFFTIEVV